MATNRFQAMERFVNESVGVIELTGDVTGFAENGLMQAYHQIVGKGLKKIILNFQSMEYMNSI